MSTWEKILENQARNYQMNKKENLALNWKLKHMILLKKLWKGKKNKSLVKNNKRKKVKKLQWTNIYKVFIKKEIKFISIEWIRIKENDVWRIFYYLKFSFILGCFNKFDNWISLMKTIFRNKNNHQGHWIYQIFLISRSIEGNSNLIKWKF